MSDDCERGGAEVCGLHGTDMVSLRVVVAGAPVFAWVCVQCVRDALYVEVDGEAP